MNVEVHSLASGSSGNAVLILADDRALLIDAGIGPRTLVPALHRRGVGAEQLAAILVTHEHVDHMCGAAAVSTRLSVPVIANGATLSAVHERTELRTTREMPTGGEIELGLFTIRSFPVSHDAAEPVGYVVQAGTTRISYATDVGCPSFALREAMSGADLCILEANHDLEWLRRGPYPPHMKARVASERGHLSNEHASDLIAERLEEDGPAAFWLAHLSRVNNSPSLAKRYVFDRVSSQTRVPFALEVALRDRPSVVWRPKSSVVQPSLF